MLLSLAKKYNTDKTLFTEHYEKQFGSDRMKVSKVIELGVLEGASILMWREYFPNAQIWGLDLNIKQQSLIDPVTKETLPRIHLKVLDQSKKNELENFSESHEKNSVDLILDDASHFMRDQQITLASLFKLVKPGGAFVIEDLHTSLYQRFTKDPAHHNWGLRADESNSTLIMLYKFIRDQTIVSEYISPSEAKYLEERIASVTICQNYHGVTAIIRKR